MLVLAPTGADAALSKTILADAGLACQVCGDLAELMQEWGVGVGAMLLTDDVLSAQDPRELVKWVEQQPVWSDLPIILLSASGADSDAGCQ